VKEKELGIVAGPDGKLQAFFKEHLLVECLPLD
jgi:hypothetical protein